MSLRATAGRYFVSTSGKNWRRWGKLLLGLGTVVLLMFAGGGLVDQLEAFGRFKPNWVFFAFVIYFLNRLVMTAKWWQLLRLRSRIVGFIRAHSIYQSCSLWGLFLPATLGADALRVICLKQEGVTVSDSFASILMERTIGLLSLLVFVAVAAALVSGQGVLPGAWGSLVMLTTFGAGAIAVGLWISILPSIPTRLMPTLLGRWPGNRLAKALVEIHSAHVSYSRPPHRVIALLGLSWIEIVMTVAFFWALLVGLGHGVPLAYLALATTGSFLLSRMPITPGGLGVFEASLSGTLLLVGIPVVDSVAVALAGRALQILNWIPWWGVYMSTSGSQGRLDPAWRQSQEADVG